MAKTNKPTDPPATDIEPAAGFGPPLTTEPTPAASSEPTATDAAAELATLRAEREALLAELAAAKARVSAAEPLPPGRYLVQLKDAPAWVVEPEPGEHPFEAYKRVTGLIRSPHTPTVTRTELPCGLHREGV